MLKNLKNNMRKVIYILLMILSLVLLNDNVTFIGRFIDWIDTTINSTAFVYLVLGMGTTLLGGSLKKVREYILRQYNKSRSKFVETKR